MRRRSPSATVLARIGNLSMSTPETFCQLQLQQHASVHICQSTTGCLAFMCARNKKNNYLELLIGHSPRIKYLGNAIDHPSQTHALIIHFTHLLQSITPKKQTRAMFTTNSNTKGNQLTTSILWGRALLWTHKGEDPQKKNIKERCWLGNLVGG